MGRTLSPADIGEVSRPLVIDESLMARLERRIPALI